MQILIINSEATMTVITPGTGATFTATTAEQQLLDIMLFLLKNEENIANNSKNINNTKCSLNLNTNTFTGSFTLPVTVTFDSSGNMLIDATNYLQNVVFSPGTGGTFDGTTPQQYLLQVMQYMTSLENDPVKNPYSKNYMSLDFQISANQITGSNTLPITFSQTGETCAITASTYLL